MADCEAPQEFQLGPAAGAMVTHVRNLQIGALVEFFFSVAGAKSGLATAQVQPIIIYGAARLDMPAWVPKYSPENGDRVAK
jgi:hypothetical protein